MADASWVSRWRWKVVTAALTALGAVASLVISADVAKYVAVASVAVLVILLVWVLSDILGDWHLKRRRGIGAVGGERLRAKEFAWVWRSARRSILCTGVGMTGILKEEELIRAAVARGVHIEFVLTDPEWLRARAELQESLDDFYGRPDFTATIASSHRELLSIRDRFNSEFGQDRVSVHTVRHLYHYSGTVADYGDANAKGLIEFHLYKQPLGRFRFRIHDYPDTERTVENPSLAFHWLAAHTRSAGRDYLGPLRKRPGATLVSSVDSSEGSEELLAPDNSPEVSSGVAEA